MSSMRPLAPKKKNLLLVFDAFGTLFEPNEPIALAYGMAARKRGILCSPGFRKPKHEIKPEDYEPLERSFKRAFKNELVKNPNYGKATGLGAQEWWTNVMKSTFCPFLKPTQEVPKELVFALLHRYSSQKGYRLFPDVEPFLQMLGEQKKLHADDIPNDLDSRWPWHRTIVGIITNSDDRVPSILRSLGLEVSNRRSGSPGQCSKVTTDEEDVNFVTLSYDVGFSKPDRRIFDAATLMLGEILGEEGDKSQENSIDTYEKLFVGDSLQEDYFGAKAAGWNAFLLDRQSEKAARLLTKVNVEMQEEGMEVVKQVDICTDLRALGRWAPTER